MILEQCLGFRVSTSICYLSSVLGFRVLGLGFVSYLVGGVEYLVNGFDTVTVGITIRTKPVLVHVWYLV